MICQFLPRKFLLRNFCPEKIFSQKSLSANTQTRAPATFKNKWSYPLRYRCLLLTSKSSIHFHISTFLVSLGCLFLNCGMLYERKILRIASLKTHVITQVQKNASKEKKKTKDRKATSKKENSGKTNRREKQK